MTMLCECVRFGFPLSETFAKLSGTAIVCSDSQSAKLDFAIDSRLRGNDDDGRGNDGDGRGNDDRFCKGLFRGDDWGGFRKVCYGYMGFAISAVV